MNLKHCVVLAAAIATVTAMGCGGGDAGGDGGGVSLQEQFTRAMADTNPQSKTTDLIKIGQQQYSAGDASGADNSLHEAMKAAKGIEDSYKRANSEAELAGAFARTNNKLEAGKLLKSALTVNESITVVDDRIDSLSRVAEIYAVDIKEPGNASSKLKDAEKLADGIDDPSRRLNALAPIVRGYRKAGKTADIDRLVGKGGELTSGITDTAKKAAALKTFARALIDAECKEEGITQLEAAAVVAKKIDGDFVKASVLLDIAEQYKYCGDTGKMNDLVKDAEVLRNNIAGDPGLQIKDRAKRLRQGK